MKPVLHATILLLSVFSWTPLSYGWSCPEHTLIAEEAGMANPIYACIADSSREENHDLLVPFHYHNAAPTTTVTPSYIDAFYAEKHCLPLYGGCGKASTVLVPHRAGILYWKIASLYETLQARKYPGDYEYALMNIAHFLGDLSQPLHNYPHGKEIGSDGKPYAEQGDWAVKHHGAFDDPFKKDPLTARDREYVRSRMTALVVAGVYDLKQKISDIANASIQLANRCYEDGKRVITREEALDCVFRPMSATHSGNGRPSIPAQAGHRGSR